MVIFYIASYTLISNKDSSEDLLKSYLTLSIILSIFISIGIFSEKMGMVFGFMFFINSIFMVSFRSALGFILCIICICTFQKKIILDGITIDQRRMKIKRQR